MGHVYFEGELFGILTALLGSIPSVLFNIASYVLTAAAIYTISRRRGLRKPWLAWIPVVNCWLLGSISDQYQYVVKGQNRSKRKWLLGLNLLMTLLCTAAAAVIIGVGVVVLSNRGMRGALGSVLALLGICLPLAGVAIAYAVIRYMALYDVFRSMDPDNSVLFLVLSILFGITEPFFLFFNRDKELGMPPRKQQPVYEQPVYHHTDYEYVSPEPEYRSQEPAPEPWDQKDYL